jgi:hypothetical protein
LLDDLGRRPDDKAACAESLARLAAQLARDLHIERDIEIL